MPFPRACIGVHPFFDKVSDLPTIFYLGEGGPPPTTHISATGKNCEAAIKFCSFSINFPISILPAITFYLIIAFDIKEFHLLFSLYVYSCRSSQHPIVVYVELCVSSTVDGSSVLLLFLTFSLAFRSILLRSNLFSILLLPY